uniref:Uncharacterized protein n=1 Tax=Spermophilus dauricus TaxID=99837 RepID=A0A8C9PV52_SPEDA
MSFRFQDLPPICDFHMLTIIISLVGLTGNASVIWFLGFRMHRNAFYTYILNLAGRNLKLVLERALQDTPEEGECGGSLPRGTLEMSGIAPGMRAALIGSSAPHTNKDVVSTEN